MAVLGDQRDRQIGAGEDGEQRGEGGERKQALKDGERTRGCRASDVVAPVADAED